MAVTFANILRLRFRQKYWALAKLMVIALKKVYYPDFF